ncbi:MAG: hypothetical protein AB7T18_19115, partial [Alphaproteobacteria bacterium]
ICPATTQNSPQCGSINRPVRGVEAVVPKRVVRRAFAVLLLHNLRSAAAKPARSKGFEPAFAADFLQNQQTVSGTGKSGQSRPGLSNRGGMGCLPVLIPYS